MLAFQTDERLVEELIILVNPGLKHDPVFGLLLKSTQLQLSLVFLTLLVVLHHARKYDIVMRRRFTLLHEDSAGFKENELK